MFEYNTSTCTPCNSKCQFNWRKNFSSLRFFSLVDALKLLNKRGFIPNVELCLHKLNVDTVESSINLLDELGISRVKTFYKTIFGSNSIDFKSI